MFSLIQHDFDFFNSIYFLKFIRFYFYIHFYCLKLLIEFKIIEMEKNS